MGEDRRYTEDEITSIFKKAAEELESASKSMQSGAGLTLNEMKEIGGEVGIPAEFIERAALSHQHEVTEHPVKKFMFAPVTVGRSVDLPGTFTDEDWNALIVDLNDTFHAQGQVQVDGAMRRWRVGNLQILVQPSENGHRLRLQSMNENQRAILASSTMLLGMSLFFMLVFAAKGKVTELPELAFLVGFALLGLGVYGVPAIKLPRWQKLRGEQMDGLAERALARANGKLQNAEAQPGHLEKVKPVSHPPESPGIDLSDASGYTEGSDRLDDRVRDRN